MKIRRYLAAALCILAAASCAKEYMGQDAVYTPRELTLEAYQGEDGPETKTVLGSDNSSVLWEDGDQISLFFGSGNNGGSCFTTAQGGKTASFSGTLNAFTAGGEGYAGETTYFWGVYPYKSATSCDNNSVTINIPSVQQGRAGSFAPGVNISVGRSENLKMGFYNVCTLVSFTVANAGITELLFKSKDEVPIVGDAKIQFETGKPAVVSLENGSDEVRIFPEGDEFEVGKKYYMAFVPVTLDGFTMTAYNNENMEGSFTYGTTKAYQRGTPTNVSNIDSRITTWEIRKGNINFADENFKSYCVQNFDTNKDGEISYAEAAVVDTIISIYSMASIDEIKYFGALTFLACSNNQLTSLDVSQNTALKELYCQGNQLACLDVSKNTALTYLQCSNNQLTSLDVSKNTALTSLECGYNQLTSLDVSKNTALTYLHCSSNQLTSLNVSENAALKTLFCTTNQLTSLDVSKNTALTLLSCSSNQLSSLDVSKNTALTILTCHKNQLISLDVSKNTALISLSCHSDQLSSLDISKNTALTSLYCYSNQLTSLDISKNTSLEYLDCSPMDDEDGQNLLSTLYIYNGQNIPLITADRNSDYIPDETTISDANPGTNEGIGEGEELEEEDQHAYVDLGLTSGTLWATMNLGASHEYEVGTIYSVWVDGYSTLESKDDDDYIYKYTKYVNSYYDFGTPDDKRTLDLSDDRANVAWGGSWHMPTKAQINELRSECTFSSATIEGVRVIIAEKDGKSVIFPLSYDGELYKAYYWSNQLTEDGGYFVSSNKDDAPLYFDETVYSMNFCYVPDAGMNANYGSSSFRSAHSKWTKTANYHFVRPVRN